MTTTPDDIRQTAREVGREITLINGDPRFVNLNDEALGHIEASLLSERQRHQEEIEQLRELLRAHHHHQQSVGTIGLPDYEGGYVEIDNGAEYAESDLCSRTTDALVGKPSELGPMPRIDKEWWRVSILERRKRRKAEARLAETMKALEPFARMTCEVQQRCFLQLLLCPKGDDDPKNSANDIRFARDLLASLKDVEVQPLYAHPAPPSGSEAMVERARTELDAAGAAMANTLYNLARQQPNWTVSLSGTLREAQERWDNARLALEAALQVKP